MVGGANATCTRLADKLLTTNERVQFYHHNGTTYTSATITAEIEDTPVGNLNYYHIEDDEYYLELIKVEAAHRQKQIHASLLKRFVRYVAPSGVKLHFAATNKEIFLRDLGERYLSPGYPNMDKFVERQMFQKKIHFPDSLLQEAAFNTPTGKVLRRLGYTRAMVEFKRYNLNEVQFIRVGAYFWR